MERKNGEDAHVFDLLFYTIQAVLITVFGRSAVHYRCHASLAPKSRGCILQSKVVVFFFFFFNKMCAKMEKTLKVIRIRLSSLHAFVLADVYVGGVRLLINQYNFFVLFLKRQLTVTP